MSKWLAENTCLDNSQTTGVGGKGNGASSKREQSKFGGARHDGGQVAVGGGGAGTAGAAGGAQGGAKAGAQAALADAGAGRAVLAHHRQPRLRR